MGGVEYHVVVAFAVGSEGALVPVVELAVADRGEAINKARKLARSHVGALAFSRTMDMGEGRYGAAKVHAIEGLIPKTLGSYRIMPTD